MRNRLAVLITAVSLGLVCLTPPAEAGPGDAVGTITYDEWHSISLNDTQGQVRNKCDCSGYIIQNYTGPAGNFHSVLGYVGTNGTTRAKVGFLLNDNLVFVAKSSSWKNDAGRWVDDF